LSFPILVHEVSPMTVWKFLSQSLRPQAARSRRARAARLLLEALEDRCVPATLFVNVNGGSDSNSGTAAAPFASIQAALNAAKNLALQGQDGNTIDVAVGTYTSSTQTNPANTLGFNSVVGVVDQQVTIQGGLDPSFSSVTG